MPYQNGTRRIVFVIALSILFLAISVYQGIRCVIYIRVLAAQSPIEYSLLRTYKEASNKRVNHKLYIRFNEAEYSLGISEDSFDNVELGKQPTLYYDSTFDSVFYEWTKNNRIKSLISSLVFFTISAFVTIHFVRKDKKEAQKQYSFGIADTTLGQYKKISTMPLLFGLAKFLFQEVFYDEENLYLKSGKVVRAVPLSSITAVKDAWSKTNRFPVWKIEWNNNGKYGSVRFPIQENSTDSRFEEFYLQMKYHYPDVIKSKY